MLELLLALAQTLAPYALQAAPLLDIPVSAQDAAQRCAAGTLQADQVEVLSYPDGSVSWTVRYGVWGYDGVVTQGSCELVMRSWTK